MKTIRIQSVSNNASAMMTEVVRADDNYVGIDKNFSNISTLAFYESEIRGGNICKCGTARNVKYLITRKS